MEEPGTPPPARDDDEFAALRSQLADTQSRLADEHATVMTLRAALEASRAEVRAAHGSLSWRVTRPLRVVWDFASGFPAFLREMRGFPRRMRYTISTRGLGALLSDIRSELSTRLRRGSLAAPPTPPPTALAAAERPFAARGDTAERRPLHLVPAGHPRASIVMPVFNQFDRTYACIASILERTGATPYEVIVVDDASEDETRDLERMITGVRVVRHETNRGFIEACNHGARVARGDFVVFLNNDTFVSQGWLDRLLEPFDTGSGETDVGLVGAKLVYPNGRLQEAGGIIFSDGSGWNYGRADDPANPRYEFICDVHYCSGACLAIPRPLFESLGGFDLRYAPMYYEDVDLAFAVRAAGRRVVYQPACVIIHFEGGTAGTDTGSGAKRYQTINQATFRDKWAAELANQPAPASDPDLARYRPTGPHVLVIDAYTPRPDRDAGSVRMRHMCEILVRLGCHVTFIPENRARDGTYTEALQRAGVEAWYHPYLPSLEHHLKQTGGRYATVIMSRVHVAEEVIDLVRTHCPGARRIFDTVDLHFLRESRRAIVDGGRGRGRQSDEAERLKSRELAVARACDLTLVVSTAERDLLAAEAPDVAVDIVSLITAPDPTDTPFTDRAGLLFIGNFQHPPNCDAVEYYIRDIHPRVREQLPDAHVTVIGANAPDRLRRLADDRIRFVGHIPDIRPHFAKTRLTVAPLRFGAGIKGKINTSLAFGVPVVTTSIGGEGMELVNGEHVLIADAADAFADAVVTLYSDRHLWERLAANGPARILAQFSFGEAERSLRRMLALDT